MTEAPAPSTARRSPPTERVVQVLALENHQLKNPDNRGRSLSAVPTVATPTRSPVTRRRPMKPCS